MMHGFGYVRINQGVVNVHWFLHVFKEHISDRWKQKWDDRIHEGDRYSVYRLHELEHSLEPYIEGVANKALRDTFARLELSVSDIKAHKLGISDIKPHKVQYSDDQATDDFCCCCYFGPLFRCSLDEKIDFLFMCKAT